MGQNFIAVVTTYFQPPIDSPAMVKRHSRVFTQDDRFDSLYQWYTELTPNEYTRIQSIEIIPES